MKIGVGFFTLAFLFLAVAIAGCREDRAVELAPMPLMEYQWGQEADDLKKALERKINLSRTDKFMSYFASSKHNRGMKNATRKKMEMIVDGAPRDKAMVERLGIDRMITFKADSPVAGLGMSPTFLFADERLVTVIMTPVLMTKVTEAWLESYSREFKSELRLWEGEITLDLLDQSEDGQSVTYNLKWQNERTIIHLFAGLRLEDGLLVTTLTCYDRSHMEKMAVTKPLAP